MAPRLNIYIKTHEKGEPIRSVANNVQAPSYKIAKCLNKELNSQINLPYTFTTKNTLEIAEELKTLQIIAHMKIITLDIEDLYVSLPIQGILRTTKFWLNKHNTKTTLEHSLQLF